MHLFRAFLLITLSFIHVIHYAFRFSFHPGNKTVARHPDSTGLWFSFSSYSIRVMKLWPGNLNNYIKDFGQVYTVFRFWDYRFVYKPIFH